MIMWLSSCIAAILVASTVIQTVSSRQPNIIWIMTDDLGYGEISAFGQEYFKTPNIDRLATEGIRFTDAYTGEAVCAPSRCSLMTGLNMGHAYIRGNGKKGPDNTDTPLRPSDITVAKLLQKAGYYTAHVGKWGLGVNESTGAPPLQGFDYYFGELSQVHAHNMYPHFLHESGSNNPSRLQEVPLTGNIPGPIQGLPILPSQLSHDATGLCVDVEGGNDATEGSALILAPCLNLPEVQKVEVMDYELVEATQSQLAVDTAKALGRRASQTWALDEQSGALYNSNSDRSLCVAAMAFATAAPISHDAYLAVCDADDPAQQWGLDEQQQVRALASGLCLTLPSLTSLPTQWTFSDTTSLQLYLHLRECELIVEQSSEITSGQVSSENETMAEELARTQTFHFILDAPSRERCMTPLVDAACGSVQQK